jgi:thioredoxin reductase (NADPH)
MIEGDDVVDVAVVGAGVAGLSASYHAAAHGASVACFEAIAPGGLIASVGLIDDFPAAAQTSGASLADILMRGAGDLGASFISSGVTSIVHSGGCFDVITAEGKHRARRVVLATGSRRRQLGVPGEQEFAKRGVSDCAWCDGGFFRNEVVAVIGGGDAAVQAALHLAKTCRRVTLIARGSALRARRRYASLAADNARIDFVWETTVGAFLGGGSLERILLRDSVDGTHRELPFTGAFVYIGTMPATVVAPTGVVQNAEGRIEADANGRTSLPGVFACGAIRNGEQGGIASALADGERAGTTAAIEADAERSSM